MWEHPVIEAVMEQFADYIVFHNNMDVGEDRDILYEYNSAGSIPTVVLGCKYARIGSGERAGEEVETNNLTALTCDLTGGMPADVCGEVQDLIEQINQ